MDDAAPRRRQPEPRRPLRARTLLAAVSAGSLAATIVIAANAILPSSPAAAVSTRSFRLDHAGELDKGELDGTATRSDGTVVVGVDARRVALPEDVALAYDVVRGPGGRVFVGTGNDGKVLVVRGDRVEELAATSQLVVSSLALGPDGVLYAGTLPDGKIFSVDVDGGRDPEEMATPEGAEHVWDLVWDSGRRVLFAATGPGGQVHAIDKNGNASVWYDGATGHVMSLALEEPGGALYAGTDGEAVALRITGPGEATVVGDFPGNEVTALAVSDGRVAVAANEFPDPPRAASSASNARVRPRRPEPGKGTLFLVDADGRTEQLHRLERGHFTDLAFDRDGAVLAAVGQDGRVVRVDRERRSAVWVDVDERQVLGLDLSDPREPLLVTGDAGALYRVRPSRPNTPTWTSHALDAGFVARFGALTWRGDGLRFQTRSGNTERPDGTWTAWSAPLTQPGPIRSPAGRFLQVRATFTTGAGRLQSVEAFYLPQNQRALVRDVGLDAKALQKRRQGRSADEPPAPSAEVPLTWKVDNPDGDRLRYRLRFRTEGGTAWRPLLSDAEVLDRTGYVWNTTGVPDGRYVVEVQASDELANPSDRALDSRSESQPLLVDNHAPRIEGLAARGGRIEGRAVDDLGPIAKLELAVDGGDWHLIFPTDDLLDDADERFRVPLGDLEAGEHIIAVRATDAGGNAATAELTVRTR